MQNVNVFGVLTGDAGGFQPVVGGPVTGPRGLEQGLGGLAIEFDIERSGFA
jgi:hypothetical protein